MTDLLPPGVILIATGLVLPLLRPDTRSLAVLGGPLATAAYVAMLCAGGLGEDGAYARGSAEYLGLTLTPVLLDPLALVFAIVFCIAAFAGGLFALGQRNVVELSAALVYAGSAIGAVTAGDVLTLFVFWELMAVASTVVIWAGGPRARRAGLRYAALHFIGGVLLMAGAAGHVAATGSADFTAMSAETPAGALMMAAFLLNAGAVPVGAWVADAYPKSSWSGMVFLSAFTTKTAVYTLIRGFPGEEMLIWIGIAMILYGLIYALFENEVRKILAYAIVNQVGLMVVAVGIGTPLALDGAAGQAFVHILYKALLIMAVGSVLYTTGRRHGTELGGLARAMPVTFLCCLAGAATAMALPLTAGFATKALISSGAGKAHELWAWLAIYVGAAGVVFNAGVRLPWLVFIRAPQRGPAPDAEDPPLNMRLAMGLLAVLCIGLGPAYGLIYALLPNGSEYQPYSLGHISSAILMTAAAAAVFVLALRQMQPRKGALLDVDWLWRGVGRAIAEHALERWVDASARWGEGLLATVRRFIDRLYRTHGPEGALARTRPSGYMALWMTLLLGAFMIAAFI